MSNIDSRKDAAFGQLPVEYQFHIAGSLELLVDHVIHAAAGIDQHRGDDGQATALFDLTRCSEEAFGQQQSCRVKTA